MSTQPSVHSGPPPTIASNGDRYWFIDRILSTRSDSNGSFEALVQWSGYANPTWEPVSGLLHTIAMLSFYSENRNSPGYGEFRGVRQSMSANDINLWYSSEDSDAMSIYGPSSEEDSPGQDEQNLEVADSEEQNPEVPESHEQILEVPDSDDDLR